MSWDFKLLEEKENERRGRNFYLLVLAVLTAAFLLVGGCSLTERLGANKQAKTPGIEDGLPDLGDEDVVLPPEQEMTKVTLYFKDQETRCLVPVTQEIPKVTGIARATLDALLQGKAEGDLKPALPAGAEVKDLNVKPDGTCVVDLNLDATKITGGDPKDEALAVYAIVNTLTEFSTVQKVQILVDGKANKTFAGHIPVDMPLLRNLTFVKG